MSSEALGALLALADARLVTNTAALDRAYIELTGCRIYLCGNCGKVTRHATRRHKQCEEQT